MIDKILISTSGQGLYEITGQISTAVHTRQVVEGLCTLFLRHTSASLVIQENADPSVCTDLESWLNHLVPENNPVFTHTLEGADDMPSHIKAMLTTSCLTIPISDGRLVLGTWQGIYLWEHRRKEHIRELVIHIGS